MFGKQPGGRRERERDNIGGSETMLWECSAAFLYLGEGFFLVGGCVQQYTFYCDESAAALMEQVLRACIFFNYPQTARRYINYCCLYVCILSI